jgi:hypothetical protein
MERMTWDKDPRVNQSLLVPEFTYGMMSPTSPEKNRQLVWHTYSAQAYKMYAGDLDFYFGGFDYRGRLESIDTKKIPVAMLTGEYDFVSDWRCAPSLEALPMWMVFSPADRKCPSKPRPRSRELTLVSS